MVQERKHSMGQSPRPKPIRLSELTNAHPTTFEITPDEAAMEGLLAPLDLLGLRKLRFSGTLSPLGKRDWQLDAKLGATVVQPCVVTLEPVSTRIDTSVVRRYLTNFTMPDEGEAEMPEDDSAEPMPVALDLWDVMVEALSIALPDFPRAEGADLGEAVYTEPGAEPLTQERVKPFAGLADLKKKMEGGG